LIGKNKGISLIRKCAVSNIVLHHDLFRARFGIAGRVGFGGVVGGESGQFEDER